MGLTKENISLRETNVRVEESYCFALEKKKKINIYESMTLNDTSSKYLNNLDQVQVQPRTTPWDREGLVCK